MNQTLSHSPDLLGLYLDEAGSFPLLTKADEMRLGQIIQEGQAAQADAWIAARSCRPSSAGSCGSRCDAADDATTEFINANLRLVVSVARKYQWSGSAPRRPDPGGQPRPDPRRREVRLAQGLQVLHLRHLVDPTVHRPGRGKHRPHRAGPRPRRRRDPAGPPAAGRDGGAAGRPPTLAELAEALGHHRGGRLRAVPLRHRSR